jgi:hypothetical protein
MGRLAISKNRIWGFPERGGAAVLTKLIQAYIGSTQSEPLENVPETHPHPRANARRNDISDLSSLGLARSTIRREPHASTAARIIGP